MDFTLEPTDVQWVQETITKATAELRATAPGGPSFADTVNVISDREKNWVRWKNDMCPPFDKEPWREEVGGRIVGLEEATRKVREQRREDPEEWTWSLGSEPLTEIWQMGYRDLADLQEPFQFSIIIFILPLVTDTSGQSGRCEGLCEENQTRRCSY